MHRLWKGSVCNHCPDLFRRMCLVIQKFRRIKLLITDVVTIPCQIQIGIVIVQCRQRCDLLQKLPPLTDAARLLLQLTFCGRKRRFTIRMTHRRFNGSGRKFDRHLANALAVLADTDVLPRFIQCHNDDVALL